MPGENTIYLSNWSSHRTPGAHGPGRKFTIMARPRAWEVGEGTVHILMPQGFEVAAMMRSVANRDDTAAMLAYREMIEARWMHTGARDPMKPGKLTYVPPPGMGGGILGHVFDGDTLCCACSVAEAAAGRCHRAWAAPYLARAGWSVVLDGVRL